MAHKIKDEIVIFSLDRAGEPWEKGATGLARQRENEMQINSIADFRTAMRLGPYAWPGGYPLYFIMSDGGALSFKTAKAQRRNLLEALRDGDRGGWRPLAVDVNWEDADLTDDHTGELIESAYGE